MCEVYGFCGSKPVDLHKYTDEFWTHAAWHKDGFGYFLADKDDYYVNPKSALTQIDRLVKHNFTSKLALCHIRFKTHGPALTENCHPFIKYDCRGIAWTLIHNGYIQDSIETAALGTIQNGSTDSERILLSIIETVNSYYEHSWIDSYEDFLLFMYAHIESKLNELSQLGKTNLIFTDSLTNNMYVYMNAPRTLYLLDSGDGFHISTTPLSKEVWIAVEPFKLHIFNNGKKLDY